MVAPSSRRELLESCLREGRLHMGQILLGRDFTLRHADDANHDDLIRYSRPEYAREISRYDWKGVYRSLRSAPNLKRGWLLETGSIQGMELALEFFYPSALGLWFSYLHGSLHPTSLRETLGRQTGMYRVTQLITDDQSQELVSRCCSSEGGCLRTLLWDLAPRSPITSLPAGKLTLESLPPDRIPLICREACNLWIAAARPVAKGNLPKQH